MLLSVEVTRSANVIDIRYFDFTWKKIKEIRYVESFKTGTSTAYRRQIALSAAPKKQFLVSCDQIKHIDRKIK